MKTTSLEAASKIVKAARDQGLVDDEDGIIIFVDLSVIADRVDRLLTCFPAHTFHAVAIKSNPLRFVLEHLIALGVGLEAASLAEVMMAQAAGASNDRVVFDCPAKTHAEIAKLQSDFRGLRVNADSLAELGRYPSHDHGLRLGLRINPLITAASDASMSVSGIDAKFGEPITNRDAIIEAIRQHESLDCLHVHIGSQYSDLEPTIQAVREVVDLAEHVNSQLGRRQIETIDIGGGFPVNYCPGEPYLIETYAERLAKSVPELFDGRYRMVTEFGRYVHGNAAFALARVEYTKPFPNGITAITHAGADNFLRECYNPHAWHHEMGVLEGNTGQLKAPEDIVMTNVAGPLCFGGDFVARERMLPRIRGGDELIIMDVGANTFSLYSRHCSRPFPKFLAYSSDKQTIDLHVARPRESFESVVAFWS